MLKKTRDFYHVQDQVSLAWRHTETDQRLRDSDIIALSSRISTLLENMGPVTDDVAQFIDLTNHKIYLLEKIISGSAAVTSSSSEAPPNDLSRNVVEVSLSSSGIGFFSTTRAEEDSSIEIFLALDTVNDEIKMQAIVVESRLSADSEKPGYWIRVRFSKGQEFEIDKLLAHVTQRQIDKLTKKSLDAPES